MAVFARQRIESLKDSFQRKIRDSAAVVGNLNHASSLRISTARAISPPWGVKSIALSIRLPSACPSSAPSPLTASLSRQRQRDVFAASCDVAGLFQLGKRRIYRNRLQRYLQPAFQSRLLQQSFHQQLHTRVCARILSVKRATTFGGGPSRRISAAPRMAASGLFSSWVRS